MTRHRIGFDAFGFSEQTDPGASGSIVINRSPAVVPLVSATAETRTLPRASRAGALVLLYVRTDGGDITLTVTGGYNEDGDTTFVFSDPGQFLFLVSLYDGSNYFWRKLADYGLGNIAPADSLVLDELSGLTATAAEINQAADPGSQFAVLTTAGPLTAADTNKTFYLNATAEFATTLPAVADAAGVRYTFIIKGAPSGASYTIVTGNTSENKILGNVLCSEDAGGSGDSEQTGGDTITFVDSKAVVGDRVDLFCDGAFWYATAFSKVHDAITITGT